MIILDTIIILLIFVPAVMNGAKKGFLHQVAGLVGIVGGGWISYAFADTVAPLLFQGSEMGENLSKPIAYVLVFLAAYWIIKIIAVLLSKALDLVFGKWLDKSLGVIFAVAKNILILSIILVVFNAVNGTFEFIDTSDFQNLYSIRILQEVANLVFPY